MIRCIDGKEFENLSIVGSVASRESDEIHIPPVTGEYPVIVIFWGRIITYASQIKRLM